jgi:hypothetical protein
MAMSLEPEFIDDLRAGLTWDGHFVCHVWSVSISGFKIVRNVSMLLPVPPWTFPSRLKGYVFNSGREFQLEVLYVWAGR